eukprot:350682-Chlamydomonas_euryale.AAC.7
MRSLLSWMCGCVNGWMHAVIDAWMGAWMDACMDAWMGACMDAWMGAWMDACMDAWMGAWMDACIDAWMDACMDACMDGFLDGWMEGTSCGVPWPLAPAMLVPRFRALYAVSRLAQSWRSRGTDVRTTSSSWTPCCIHGSASRYGGGRYKGGWGCCADVSPPWQWLLNCGCCSAAELLRTGRRVPELLRAVAHGVC